MVSVLAAFLVRPCSSVRPSTNSWRTQQAASGRCMPGASPAGAQLVADGAKFVQKEDIVPAAADGGSSGSPGDRAHPTWWRWPSCRSRRVWPASTYPRARSSCSSRLGWTRARHAHLPGGRARHKVRPDRGPGDRATHLLRLPIVARRRVRLPGRRLPSLPRSPSGGSRHWLLWQLPGAIVFLVAAVAELQRPLRHRSPMPNSSWKDRGRVHRAPLRLLPARRVCRDRGAVLLFAALWLGGGTDPSSEHLGWVWTPAQGLRCRSAVIWMRVAWPRVRADQLQRLAWLWLVPLALQLASPASGW